MNGSLNISKIRFYRQIRNAKNWALANIVILKNGSLNISKIRFQNKVGVKY